MQAHEAEESRPGRDRNRARPALALLATDVMSTATTVTPIRREPELLGQTVVVIGGSAGIGLETGRRARAEEAT